MTLHDDDLRLQHMLDHAREAIELTEAGERDDLDSDRVLSLALVRLLEIIGEAAGRVSEEKQRQLSGVPWLQIISLRNRLIHGYDSVDMDVLWEIIRGDLPGFIDELEKNTSE